MKKRKNVLNAHIIKMYKYTYIYYLFLVFKRFYIFA